MSDEDWFERARQEIEGEAGDEAADGRSADGGASGPAGDDADPNPADGDEGGTDQFDGTDASAWPDFGDGSDGADFGGGGYAGGAFGGNGFDGGGFGGDEGDQSDEASRFDGSDGSDRFDVDEFAFEPDEDFGFGEFDDFGGGFGDSLDEAEFDSNIPRTDVGITGLDEMILGGVPERSLMVAIGSAGTGKTTFGIQFLQRALSEGGRGVFITLEQSRQAIVDTAEEKGWPFGEYEETGRLAVVAMDPIEMANSLDSIRNDIARLVEEFDADRLVLDSVSLLEMMYDHPARRRSEVFDFTRALKRAGVTTMLTSEASEDSPYASRYGVVEYLTDAVFVLQYVRPSNFRETRLAIEIQKIRDANHSRETKPYEITDSGISVYRQANIF